MLLTDVKLTEIEAKSDEISEDARSIGELKDVSLEVGFMIVDNLKSMLESAVEDSSKALNIADLKDITSMIKDVSMQITKLEGGNASSNGEGLATFLTRLKA